MINIRFSKRAFTRVHAHNMCVFVVCTVYTLTAADDQRDGTYIFIYKYIYCGRSSAFDSLGTGCTSSRISANRKKKYPSMKGDPDTPIFLPIDFTNTSQPQTLGIHNIQSEFYFVLCKHIFPY